ncbi:hypothetical protein [Actinoplanes derwentensis]|uniref:Uncharacterized protein n=1 Tax=Actinoplanes derwentensis TaxID=113562 RepID=A0A1H1SBE0_9ACTN|nr:hypothetical protein [Actinoplanes derwentensis]GID83344.1 hypothetical protein Ade03nite_22680 [Actinoplanes derwentensis]SDS45295.1 hypothetical protein SAMN04489716_0818 [Actinoplanes derwentensis]
MPPTPRTTELSAPLSNEVKKANVGAGTYVSRHRSPDLTNINTQFQRRAVAALELVSKATGDSPTDVLNRAVQFYAYLIKKSRMGEHIFVENMETGARERITLF